MYRKEFFMKTTIKKRIAKILICAMVLSMARVDGIEAQTETGDNSEILS